MAPSDRGDVARTTIVAALAAAAALVVGAFLVRPDRAPPDAVELAASSDDLGGETGDAPPDDHDEHDEHAGHDDHDDHAGDERHVESVGRDEHDEHDDHDEHLGADTGSTASEWPRPFDPDEPLDFSGVAGVTPDQQARAEQLVADTMRDLPRFADVTSIGALGYTSIGDAATGFEHFVNRAMIVDDRFLDPTAPESLVYAVDGESRTLVSAMFIASARELDDPELLDFGGPLMQWHVHGDLCWALDDDGDPVVIGVLETFGGSCPPGSVNAGGEFPMVHVWIVPHLCGPFAALEGHGAGQTSVGEGARMDLCEHEHGGHGGQPADAGTARPYDATSPVDLGGTDGVTDDQQAFAEDLVERTLRDLPQWADLDVVEAAGFRSIRDGATGHEHYIQWEWIDDDVWLDPNFPESLVFEPQPDGSKRLVSAMYMLPSDTALDEVPDWGGALMQWHVHGDLCFTDGDTPVVAGVKELGGTCPPPLVDGPMAPMIHVWIRPHECGPFAALDGIAGGQVPEGESVLCDHAHGSG